MARDLDRAIACPKSLWRKDARRMCKTKSSYDFPALGGIEAIESR